MTSALNFPSNPTNGQQFTVGTRIFSWDGTAWRIVAVSEEDPALTQEEIQDFVAPLLNHSSHTNLTASYDDNANKIILTGTATVSDEQIQDAIAPLFDHANHTNITASYDDENNKILLTAEEAGSTVTVSDTAPVSPVEGNIWYNSSIAKLFIYYDNLWVEV